MSNSLDADDLEYYPTCNSCGAEFTEQEDIDALVYSRTTASGDLYYCSECEKESVSIIDTRQPFQDALKSVLKDVDVMVEDGRIKDTKEKVYFIDESNNRFDGKSTADFLREHSIVTSVEINKNNRG